MLTNFVYPINFSITKEILTNKIIFIHNYSDRLPIVSTIIFLKMGEIYEPHKLSGISELLQATITKGTKNRTAQQIAQEIESLGGTISADSGDDFSTLSISVRTQYFEHSVEILSDIFFNPTFPEEEIEKEKNNIIAGILARKDNIFEVAIDELLCNMYGKKHPYGKHPYEIIKHIRKLSRKEILSWWENFYGIDYDNKNIIIVVSGDIEFQKAKQIIEKNFSNIKPIKIPSLKEYYFKNKPKIIRKKTHFKQAYLMYGYFAPSIKIENFKKYLSLKLLNLYLGGGMSGKLFEILREEKSLCYETNCFYPTKFLDSHFVIYLGLDAKKINIAKQEIEKILNYLKYNGITQQELSECKNKLKGRYLLDHQTNLRQAWYLGFWEVLGLDYIYDKKYIEELENVSLDDIKNVIHEITEVKPYILELIPK
ncbi:MAG: pitrilysin family protein [Elusimicrobiota bacterium]|nr:insulinase family protein [Endomicrobiia bacterium]MDW8165389.1 pitrilysin family protein [Elusimicrobiota bacterium]